MIHFSTVDLYVQHVPDTHYLYVPLEVTLLAVNWESNYSLTGNESPTFGFRQNIIW